VIHGADAAVGLYGFRTGVGLVWSAPDRDICEPPEGALSRPF
jgi:hypothetical protein